MNIVHKEQVIIDYLIEELDKKRDIAINKKKHSYTQNETSYVKR